MAMQPSEPELGGKAPASSSPERKGTACVWRGALEARQLN